MLRERHRSEYRIGNLNRKQEKKVKGYRKEIPFAFPLPVPAEQYRSERRLTDRQDAEKADDITVTMTNLVKIREDGPAISAASDRSGASGSSDNYGSSLGQTGKTTSEDGGTQFRENLVGQDSRRTDRFEDDVIDPVQSNLR